MATVTKRKVHVGARALPVAPSAPKQNSPLAGETQASALDEQGRQALTALAGSVRLSRKASTAQGLSHLAIGRWVRVLSDEHKSPARSHEIEVEVEKVVNGEKVTIVEKVTIEGICERAARLDPLRGSDDKAPRPMAKSWPSQYRSMIAAYDTVATFAGLLDDDGDLSNVVRNSSRTHGVDALAKIADVFSHEWTSRKDGETPAQVWKRSAKGSTPEVDHSKRLVGILDYLEGLDDADLLANAETLARIAKSAGRASALKARTVKS